MGSRSSDKDVLRRTVKPHAVLALEVKIISTKQGVNPTGRIPDPRPIRTCTAAASACAACPGRENLRHLHYPCAFVNLLRSWLTCKRGISREP